MQKRYPRGIMATACIPWTADYRFDEGIFRREAAMLCEQGMNSVYLFGTAGEGYSVSNDQFESIVRVFCDEMRGRDATVPMVGIISLSLDEILRRIEFSAGLGIRDFQISFPSWGAVSESEAFLFFRAVLDRFPELRFMHYNNGPRAHLKLTGAQYESLAREFQNLAAVKYTGATIPEILDIMTRDIPIQFFFLERAYGYACLAGEASLLISISNINYRLAYEYFDAGSRQDAQSLIRMEKDFERCIAIISKYKGKIDGAYDKLFVKYSIPEFPHRLCLPYKGFSEEEWTAFDTELRAALPHWFY